MFNCAESKKMLFSPEKCKVVVFYKKINNGQINVKLQRKSLELLDCEKLLGLKLDSKLSWKNHVKEQTSKCKQTILQLNQCCSLNWGLKKSILKQIWIGVIQPILLYGCPS